MKNQETSQLEDEIKIDAHKTNPIRHYANEDSLDSIMKKTKWK